MGAAGYAISAVMSLAAARQAQKAYANDAQAAMEQAEVAKIQADQEAINRTAQLNAQLARISASQSGGGVSIGTSGSFQALKKNEVKLANADISAIKFMGLQNRRKFQLDAKSKKLKGKAAVITGVSNAASAGSKAYYANKTGTA